MKKIIIVIISILAILTTFLFIKNTNKINDDYYLKLIGGTGEQTYTTYLYWNGGQKAKYICTTSTTKSYGSSKWIEKVTKKGNLAFMQGIYDVAKNNNSFDYVIMNKDVIINSTNVSYKKGDVLTIDQLYDLFNIIGTK